MSQLTRLLGIALILLIVLGPLSPVAHADSRLEQIQAQIHDTEQMLAETTNEVERAQWEQRLSLLNQDLESTQRRLQLEEKEKKIRESHRHRAGSAIREELRTVETDTMQPTEKQRRLDRMIRDLRTTRGDMEERLSVYEADAENNEERITDLNLRLRNLDEEIRARIFERDTAELNLRLATQAVRIDELIRDLPANPDPTVRLLLERRRYLDAENKKIEDITAVLDVLQQRRGEVETALNLSREKSKHVDAEIALLDKKRGVADNRRELRNMIYAANTEKKILSLRVDYQEQQLAAIDESMDTANQLKKLYDLEVAYLGEEYAALAGQYRKSLLVPIAIIGGMIVLRALISWFILPIFLSRDTLFVGRRLSNYILVLLIIIVLAVFFLEDLKQIATVLGIASAAIVIALQDLCSAFAGWFVIVASRKFSIGDRVEIDGQRGDVIDIQLLRTTILEVSNWLGVDEPTGRVILVPNNFVFKSKVFNYSHVHPYVWMNVDIIVTFETPASEAQALLFKILEEETRGEFEDAKWAAAHMEKHTGSRTRCTSRSCIHSSTTAASRSG